MKAKFEIQELLGIGMTIVVLGIAMAYGIQVIGESKEDIGDTIASGTATNESHVFVNQTLFALDNPGAFRLSCSAVRDNNGSVVPASNYTCNQNGVTITDQGGVTSGDNGTVYVDYTYKYGNEAYNASNDALTGVAKLPQKLPTIVTVIVASVIIGILMTYLWARFQ